MTHLNPTVYSRLVQPCSAASSKDTQYPVIVDATKNHLHRIRLAETSNLLISITILLMTHIT